MQLDEGSHNCTLDQTCVNLDGSYYCETICGQGFQARVEKIIVKYHHL